MRKFETKTALAKELNITRSTLYARASKYDIDLNALDTEGLTDEQIKVLSTDMSVASDVELKKEVGRLKAEIERLNNLNNDLESERQTAQTEASSYKEKFEELNADYIASLKEANEKYYRLFDQSQILQLNGANMGVEKDIVDGDVSDVVKRSDSQTIDNDVDKKGFWSKLFNK
ncbi:hypothetical protein [Weissella cibaria]|uniref:DUF536 domain-containing protein n=1 Tax=Weissella cibaria TaxID=137591 RepID=A0A9Q8N9Y7_9LACO|nr:hypothetical protein [Weissella cibaria]TVV33001.1 hypothetical protein FO435_00095 [Weissella cibaria]TVV39360.1 hypothetical protein FO438_11785 [Weissella cibaria]TVV39387.1 hypothetical protein FO438_11940 [Weissella cibaria]